MTTHFEHGGRLSTPADDQRTRVLHVLHDTTPAETWLAHGVTPGAVITSWRTCRAVIFRCNETQVAVEPQVTDSILARQLQAKLS